MQEQYTIMALDWRKGANYHFGMNALKKIRETKGVSQARLAELAGTTQPQINRLEAAKRKLTKEWAERLAPHLGVKPVELLFGSEDEASPQATGEVVNSDGEKITLPEGAIGEVDSRAGLGGGQHVPEAFEATDEGWRVVDAMKPEPWILPPSFVRSGFRAPISSIIAMTTQGESMAPTINHGDVVFIDTTHQRISPPGLYAMRDIYGEIIVKRLEAFREKGEAMVRIESDNPSHGERFERIADIQIVGRICGMMKLV
ncbi:helix-turn-helix domain-containing protein [Methylocystis sp. MJC1]|uniref:XRE family transcriptional regulator n=1 Tax=Methylocystis sp. MJC1 TaxID=2654282 RepID=UPI0013ED061A|nr:LexA family transcriptional regulator [Methylocystis sp. MJC1]KAF2991133.1 hypothetical protein MJC1_01866 [Methylocystis sp. MJC1]MBU6525945.1 LexA family transcriptional regulator [Methylocystis sp. MJC1]UZX12411.1 helix-turn-helix domain-containing protein [Methylocystis sp. MJC1]